MHHGAPPRPEPQRRPAGSPAPGGDERLRLVHVVGGTRTGCTRVVLDLLARQDRARFDLAACFFTRVAAEPEVTAAVDALGLPWRDVHKQRRYDAASVVRLARALADLGAEAVVLHGFGAYTFGVAAARMAGVKLVIRVEHSPELYTRAHRLAARATAGLADSTVLVSRYLGRYLHEQGVDPPRPEVIENGIELARFLSVERAPFAGDGTPVVLMVARLDRSKDHATLLRAVALLAARGIDLRLRLAGVGPLSDELRELARAEGIADRVELLGHRGDIPALLEQADVAVLSTRYEGFGLVVAEAMAAGRPVVATRIASLPELIDHGRTGLLVAPGSAEELAGALALLIAEPDRARALGEAGREEARARFSLARAAAAFDRHVLATAARRGLGLPGDGGAAAPLERPPAAASPIPVTPSAPGLRAKPPVRAAEPLRVLHVINDLGTAGAEQVVRSLIAGRAPHVVAAVARLNEIGELDAAVRAAGAEVFPLHLARAADLPLGLWRLAALVRRFRPHVLHTHLLHAEILGGAVGRALGLPVVATVHNVMWADPAYYGATLRAAYLATLRANDHTVAVIDPVGELVRDAGVSAQRVSVIANGIRQVAPLPRDEARARLGLPADGGLVIGALGNLYPYKGHDLLIEALARLLPAHPDARLVVIGHGAHAADPGCRDALVARARALGIAGRLHLPGRVPEAATLLAAFDLYAQPSRTEGASIALLEALAAGLPCVATTAGGTPALIGASGAAVLVAPDDLDALTAALASLAHDPAARAQLGQRARLHAAGFGAAAMTAAYERVYHRVLGRAELPRRSESLDAAAPRVAMGRA